jgi:hypothetical protein
LTSCAVASYRIMLGAVFTVLALGALVGLIVYLFIIEPRSKYHDSHGL